MFDTGNDVSCKFDSLQYHLCAPTFLQSPVCHQQQSAMSNDVSFSHLYLQIKPLHDAYLDEVSSMIWEQLNRFWAESYEACKASAQKLAKNMMESRRKFQVCRN